MKISLFIFILLNVLLCNATDNKHNIKEYAEDVIARRLDHDVEASRQLDSQFDHLIEDHLNRFKKKVVPVNKDKDTISKENVKDKGKDEITDDEYNDQVEAPAPRTATGGAINTLMIVLTLAAFIGNAAFLVHVFWFNEKIDHKLTPPTVILPFNNFGMGPLGGWSNDGWRHVR
jgi:hypothetical protein